MEKRVGPERATSKSAEPAEGAADAATVAEALACAERDAMLTNDYRTRVRVLRMMLDFYERELDARREDMRLYAQRKIDEIGAVVDGVRAHQRLRLHLLEALDEHVSVWSDAEVWPAADLFVQRLDAPIAVKLAEDDAVTALAVWRGERQTPALPRKWEFLADLTQRLGLGEVKWKSLKRDWEKWCEENPRPRDLHERLGVRKQQRMKNRP